MARNFAQLVFLGVCALLILSSRKVIFSLLKQRVGEREARRQSRGFINGAFFLLLKGKLPPALYWLHAVTVGLTLTCALLQLILGWFAFAALFFRILNSLAILASALLAFTMAAVRNTLAFGTPFVLYREDQDPATGRAFASTVVDALLFSAVPLFLIICNFVAI